MSYSRQYILDRCQEAIKEVNSFYDQKFIDYRGRCSDTREYCTEVIAEFILTHIDAFVNGFPNIIRKKSYKTPGHDGVYDLSSPRKEENLAKQMYCGGGEGYDHIGKIIDYQTPLKDTREDGAGKIDLLAFDGQNLRLLELKQPGSKETMLRCVLEGYTYLKTVDHSKLVSDFNLPDHTIVRASPFVYKGGKQWAELKKVRPLLRRLMVQLDSEPFAYDEQLDEEKGKVFFVISEHKN